MSDQEIITAFEKLHRLHSTSGEAVGQFAAIGAIREVIFVPVALFLLLMNGMLARPETQ